MQSKISSLLCSQNLIIIIIKEDSVVKLSAIWRQHFSASCLAKKSTSRLEIALQTLRTCKLMKNLFYVVILKILLLGLTFLPACFLREFPVALEFLFKINLNGPNHLCTDGT